ncbi:MAG TPA: NAD(P)-dependent oxidoreductase [Chloroflexia bacterium]|nr:NAD(P)-dependent oxidoreductase [Chloroflexia bacterium]
MRVLITGGAGFLGGYVARRLSSLGHSVVVYDEAVPPPESGLPAEVVVVQWSVLDRVALVDTMDTHRIDRVVHLATLLTGACAEDPAQGALVNGVGTATVFDAAWQAGVRRVVYGSSVAALGYQSEPAPGDTAMLNPTSVYGATKAFAEMLAGALRTERPEQELVGLRFGWVYGAGRVRGWTALQEMIEAFALGRDEVPYPDYDRPNDWTYVDDAVDAVVRCLDSPRPSVPAYNAPGAYRAVQDAAAHLGSRFPDARPVPYPAELPPVAWDFRLDRIAHEAGYRPRVPLEMGLDLAVAAVRRERGLPPMDIDNLPEDSAVHEEALP